MIAPRTALVVTSLFGVAAALLVGIGENLVQFVVGGDYADPSYAYFGVIEPGRQTVGHFLSVLAAPLYLVGYWHLCRMLEPANRFWARVLFFIGAYAFVVGAAWMGGRVYLALVVHQIQDRGTDLSLLLQQMAEHNEPLVNVLRIAIVVISVIWVSLVLTGRSRYPKAMALANPAFILGGVFALYFLVPAVGVYVLPSAMNVTHGIIFSLSAYFAWRSDQGRTVK